MSNTTVTSPLEQWREKFFLEFIRDNAFSEYMGTDDNAVINIDETLTKESGDRINFHHVSALTGNGVTGSQTLEGQEEELGNFVHAVNITTRRNAVLVTKDEKRKTNIDVFDAARNQLKFWLMDRMRTLTIQAFLSPVVDGVTTYADATEGQKDTWVTNNSDRVLFGAAVGNYSAADHSASLLNVDQTNDTLDTGMISLAKRIARTATAPAIRPIRVNGSEEYYVMFVPSLPFRDLKTDATMTQANREAWQRGKDNPLFRDGDLIWDGVIIREVPEMPVQVAMGNSADDVAASVLCGAQMLGWAWGERPTPISNERDYTEKQGVGIKEVSGCEKLNFGDTVKQGGVTVWAAAEADS